MSRHFLRSAPSLAVITSKSPVRTPAILSDLLHYLQLSIDHHSSDLASRIHALAFPLGLHTHPLISTKLISAYAHLGDPSTSRLVFDAAPDKSNPFLWNSLFSAYSRCLFLHEPLEMFPSMLSCARPDVYTVSILAKAAGEVGDVVGGRKIHCLVEKLGFGSDCVVMNSLMGMYFKCKEFHDACELFEEIPVRSAPSWNALMLEYLNSNRSSREDEVWKLVRRMQLEGQRPDEFTISIILPLCSLNYRNSLLYGREIHGYAVKNGLGSQYHLDFHVESCLIDMYCKCGNALMGRRVFDQMTCKNVVTWTSMVTGYVQHGEFEEALLLFRIMMSNGDTLPNKVTLLSVLNAAGSLANYNYIKEIHSYAVRALIFGEISLKNALIDAYFKCGSLVNARRIFDDNSWEKDSITWSSMLYGYGLHGKGQEAISVFHEMCNAGHKLNNIACIGIISACRRSGLIAEGISIYNSLIGHHQIIPTHELFSCVIDMMCHDGQLYEALDFIKSIPLLPCPSIWGTLFNAAAAQGNKEVQMLAYGFLLQEESDNPSNYIMLSNSHASSCRWDVVTKVRRRMGKKGLQKLAGISWICAKDGQYSSSLSCST